MSSTASRREDEMSSADKTVTRRLVQNAILKTIQSEGNSLGEVRPSALKNAKNNVLGMSWKIYICTNSTKTLHCVIFCEQVLSHTCTEEAVNQFMQL